MLLEDLGDVCLWDRVREAPEAEVIRWYRKAIDELLVLQIGGTRGRERPVHGLQTGLRPAAVSLEFAHFIEYGLEGETRGACRRGKGGCWTRPSSASPGISTAARECSIIGTTIAGT